MPTEREMLDQLGLGLVTLPPLSICYLEDQSAISNNNRFDATVKVSWGRQSAKFAVECKPLSTPKAFYNGLNLLRALQLPEGYCPMLFMPFLSENQLSELERSGISGIDMCGNGVVVVPQVFAVFRSGKKNLFSSSAPIKNIYKQNSSMVSRVFIARSSYGSVQEIRSEIIQRNMLVNRWDKKPMGLSTVSKSLKALEEDLIVGRGGLIRLLQPDKLLQKLTQNFAPPKIAGRIQLKVANDNRTIRDILMKQSQDAEVPIVATGLSSVNQYAIMQRGDILSVYCPRMEKLVEQLPGSRSDRFPNLEIIETEDETVYFDARQTDDFWWSSTIQVYLELMAGDKRDQETAEQVKSYILNNLKLVGI